MTDSLAIGRLTKPFGVKGGVKTLSFSGESNHFFNLFDRRIELRRKKCEPLSLRVKSVEMKGPVVVLYFHGYETPEEVLEICGRDIYVNRNLAAPLQEGEFYMSDLIGCILLHQGEPAGTVIGFFEAAQMILEVRPPNAGKCFYIPFNRVFIGEIDLYQKTIELTDSRLL